MTDLWRDILSPALVFLSANHLGDAAGIAGLLVTFLAFWKAKRAHEAATDAAKAAKASMYLFDSISQISIAIAALEEIKRHYYAESWSLVADRCSSLRRLLIITRSSNPNLNEAHQTTIQNAITHLADIEKRIDRSAGKGDVKIPKLPGVISDNLDQLLRVLIDLKTSATGDENGN